MIKVETNKWLGTNQIGRRKNISAVETATINELIIENIRLAKYSL